MVRSSMIMVGLLVLLLVHQGAPAGAQAPAQELTVEDAIRIAMSRNPGFQARQNDESVATWSLRSSVASLLPSAHLTSQYQYQGGGESRLGSIRLEDLGLSSDLPAYYISSYDALLRMEINGAKLISPFQQRARREATRARIENASLSLVQAVVGHYLGVLRGQERERVVTQEVERAREDLRMAQIRAELGAAAEWEVQRAQVTLGRAEIDLLKAQNELRTARLRFAQQLGLPPDEEFVLTSRFELFEPRWEEEDLYEIAVASSPELSSLRAEERASRHGVRIARSQYLPSLWLDGYVSGFTRHTRDEDRLLFEAENSMNRSYEECLTTNRIYSGITNPLPTRDCSLIQFNDSDRRALLKANDAFPFKFITTPPVVTLGISFPVFQGMTRRRDVAVAKAQAEDTRLLLEERTLGLRADVAAALGEVKTAYRSALLEETNQEVARQQLRLARERYERGGGSFLELVEAETVMASSDRALVEAVYGFHQAVVDLETLVGRSLGEDSREE